jgi:arsenate reductase (thioredoxin)
MHILFLCTGNSCRSQMAEAWAKHLSTGEHQFFSAGTRPEASVSSAAMRVMSEKGISLEGQFPKSPDSVGPVDLFVAVCAKAAATCPPPSPCTTAVRWDLPDPADATGTEEEILDVFRASRDEIEKRVRELLANINGAESERQP